MSLGVVVSIVLVVATPRAVSGKLARIGKVELQPCNVERDKQYKEQSGMASCNVNPARNVGVLFWSKDITMITINHLKYAGFVIVAT